MMIDKVSLLILRGCLNFMGFAVLLPTAFIIALMRKHGAMQCVHARPAYMSIQIGILIMALLALVLNAMIIDFETILLLSNRSLAFHTLTQFVMALLLLFHAIFGFLLETRKDSLSFQGGNLLKNLQSVLTPFTVGLGLLHCTVGVLINWPHRLLAWIIWSTFVAFIIGAIQMKLVSYEPPALA